MTALRRQMIEAMQLRGLSPGTQQAYLRAIHRLAQYFNLPPDQLTPEHLRHYFLYLRNDQQVARSTSTVALCALKFLYEHTLQRPWPLLDLVRAPKQRALPVILSVDEVHQVLAAVHAPHYHTCLSLMYACGLRIQEGVSLQVAHIDSARMVVHIHAGKGNKDRCVPLPPALLELLRDFWRTHRHPRWIRDAARVAVAHCPLHPSPWACAIFKQPFRLCCWSAIFASPPRSIPFAIRGQPICSKLDSTCASFKNGWATTRHAPRPCTPI